jgi:pimeloyl-ACP methyl ester carboxylesterase
MKTIAQILLAFYLTCSAQAQQSITVTVTGSGDPILFLGGFATAGDAVWQETVDQLAKTHQCHVINYAGFAGQDAISVPWLPQVVDGIESYMLENDLKNITIIGHSLGGTLGIDLAANTDLNISKLLIIDALPANGALMFPNFDPKALVYESPYNQQMLDMDDTAFSQMAMGMAAGMATDATNQKQIVKWMKTTDRKTYVYGYTDYLKFDMRERLKEINIPVTILAAGKPYGADVVKANYEKQYENLKNYDFQMNADSAHFIMMDQPEWFMEQVQNFLKS